MTDTLEHTDVEGEESESESGGKRGRTADRDFTKHNDSHQELADFVNAHSGLDAVTPFQVKAIQLLATDFRNSPEAIEARKVRKAARDAEKKEFEGLDDDDVKAIKAARRAEENAAKLREKANAALERAKAVQTASDASGEDLAAVVNGAQDEAPAKRRPGRRS
jgi:hypothetical protein